MTTQALSIACALVSIAAFLVWLTARFLEARKDALWRAENMAMIEAKRAEVARQEHVRQLEAEVRVPLAELVRKAEWHAEMEWHRENSL